MTNPSNESGAPNPSGDHKYGDLRGPDLARAALAAARSRARRIEEGKAARRGGAEAQSRRSGARPDERDPQPLEAALSRLLAEAGWEAPAAVGGVFQDWTDIVGEAVAAHCQPVAYEDGVLTLHTDSQLWAIELKYSIPKMMTSLNSRLPRRQTSGSPSRPAVDRIDIFSPESLVRRRGRLSANGSAGRRPDRRAT